MTIRKAAIDDINDLIRLRVDYLTEHFGALDDSQNSQIRSQLESYYKTHLLHDFIAYIAEDEGSAIASAFLVVQEKPANPRFLSGRTGLILNVYTCSAYRRRGIARLLLSKIIDEAKSLGLSFIELTATEAGKGLYSSFGFVSTDRHDDMMLVLSN